MLNLKEYREYWKGLSRRVPGLTGCMAVTVDENMAKRIMGLPKGSVTLFYLPPGSLAEGADVDSYREKNDCVVFVMEKYDPQRRDSFSVLESTQEVIEGVKGAMLADMAMGCPVMRMEVSSFSTLAETQFFAGFAGWSLGFKVMD